MGALFVLFMCFVTALAFVPVFTKEHGTPIKSIVWFRNETSLLVLWQPPYPPGNYTHYKISILPPDALESEQIVKKESDPPGPAQAGFKGLVPGRVYTISIQTALGSELSEPTLRQYRTVPLRPSNVSVEDFNETSLRVSWLPPRNESEFDSYKVSLSGPVDGPRFTPVLVPRNGTRSSTFEGLEPGAQYLVNVKTMSGKVTSWPTAVDVTLTPLPVTDLSAVYHENAEIVGVSWLAADNSIQDEYKVSFHENSPSYNVTVVSLKTPYTSVILGSLLPGRNYTIRVAALSNSIKSDDTKTWVITRP